MTNVITKNKKSKQNEFMLSDGSTKDNKQIVVKITQIPKQRQNRITGSFCVCASQWEMVLHCNAISHWLGAYTEWSVKLYEKYDL